MTPAVKIVDQAQRSAAIDPQGSFIVQAPAGSGKTELLIQRFLALLGQVERPQQILAITFTRKAAAEMRCRLLDALNAAQEECPTPEHKRQTWQLASRALEQDHKLGWNLLQNPSLLSIQTIDSFNAALVRKMPWLSRFGGLPELAEDADRLYLQAAEKLLGRLGREQSGSEQLALLLAHLDNRMDRLQQMLVEMLRKRDQWLRHLVGSNGTGPRELLESGLVQLVESCLVELTGSLPAPLQDELLCCGRYAAANLWDQGERPLLNLTDLDWLPTAAVEHLPLWQGVADLLLTATDDLRKARGITVKCGFPAGKDGQEAKQRMQTLLQSLEEAPEFIRQLVRCRQLPRARYAAEQWQILQALVELLPILVAELWLVFRGEGQADFAEIALKAQVALGSAEDPSDLLLKLDSRMEHILVDEFQDTNWLQYQLLQTLTAGWQSGDGRSLFLVGDPMQSIYRFREAEVGLFLRSFAGQLGDSGPQLHPLQLQSNFRSQRGIVDWVNRSFAEIFPPQVDEASGAVPLSRAAAVHAQLTGPACQLHPFAGRDDSAEAQAVVELIAALRRDDRQQTIAILVRSRTHLPEILRLLRLHKIAYQAQDIDLLGEQPVALDILALTRALLHRADRLAWLTLLRAPWAALSLDDLHILVASSPRGTLPSLLTERQRLQQLSTDGQQRLARIWPILEEGLKMRGRIGLRQLVEGCWLALGGPACYDSDAVENAQLVFELLESLQRGGELPALELFEQRLKKLFTAPDSTADGTLRVMTIHKSKGLEFDQVILPGLGRKPRGEDTPLLRWLEHPKFGLLLAPIAPRDGSDQDPIYRLIGRLEREKQEFEIGRLLYVATTRAKTRLHLFGHARENANGELRPERGSLLEVLWPVVETEFISTAIKTAPTEDLRRFLPLRRLPLNWQAPELVAAPLPVMSKTGKASDSDATEAQELIFSGWEKQARRHVGTLVHSLLEQIATQGVETWQRSDMTQRQLVVARQLGALGVPLVEQKAASARVFQALQQTLAGDRGRWLLARHPHAECELALTGMVNGKLIHAVIDRTFVTADGVRWVIDYKTSAPQTGETMGTFYRREADHYQGQLVAYKELLKALDMAHEIKMALYFPLIDGWCELADSCGTGGGA
jgi:ATP-dependent exoDNAse (exonuclease V) beta subunit